MKRLLTISAQRNSKYLNVLNTIQNGDFPSKNDISQSFKLSQEDYSDRIFAQNEFQLLPSNTVWFSSDRRSLLIEEAPSYKDIRFRRGKKEAYTKKVQELTLPFPWLYYGISPDKNKQPYVSHLWAAPRQMAEGQECLYFIPIPNVFKHGAICTHTLSEEVSDLPYHLLVNQAIMDFWDSVFNLDVNHYSASALYERLVSSSYQAGDGDAFSAWSKLTCEQFMNYELKYWLRSVYVSKIPDIILKFNDFYSLGADQAGLLMSELLIPAMEIQIS